jgi:pyruvate dehydrogenase E2 component (dihydrolipoamide acetyltransferase)
MKWLQHNMELGSALSLSPWRKTAIATWPNESAASVYGLLEVDMGPCEHWLEVRRHQVSERLTITHVVGRIIAVMLSKHPEANSVVRLGRLYPRKHIDIFFQATASEDGKDLSGVTLRKVDTMSVDDIASNMNRRVRSIRAQQDETFAKSKRMMSHVPSFLLYYLMLLMDFVLFTLNLWSPLLGVPRDAFGSVMITNIGSLGLSMAFPPLIPYAHCSMIFAVGKVRTCPTTQRRLCNLCVTFDHRILDGAHAARMTRTMEEMFAHPDQYLG